MNYKGIRLLISLSILMMACKPRQNQDVRSIIHQTSDSIGAALKAGDAKKFITFFNTADLKELSTDEEIVAHDVALFANLHKAYFADKPPVPEYQELYTQNGQYVVKLPIYNRPDSVARVHEMHLNLYFGPFKVFKPNKITGYELVRNNEDSSRLKPLSYWQGRQ